MVTLDAAAITRRIGIISHAQPRQPQALAPIYQAIGSRNEPTEAKWRRALRPRPIS